MFSILHKGPKVPLKVQKSEFQGFGPPTIKRQSLPLMVKVSKMSLLLNT